MDDRPADVSGNTEHISIVYGDESLPRLYENSQVSSNLPGQPGKSVQFFLLFSLLNFLGSVTILVAEA